MSQQIRSRRLTDPSFLLGAVAVLSVWLAVELSRGPDLVSAQTAAASASGNLVAVTGQVVGRGNADALYIYDKDQQKLVCYMFSSNRFEVLAIRDCQYDWQAVEFGKQEPSVKAMRDASTKKK